MSWVEVIQLVKGLLSDPSTHTAASVAGWAYPMSREAFVLADLHDRYTTVNFQQAKPYPRPMDTSTGRSQAPQVSQAVIRRALAARGHGMN